MITCKNCDNAEFDSGGYFCENITDEVLAPLNAEMMDALSIFAVPPDFSCKFATAKQCIFVQGDKRCENEALPGGLCSFHSGMKCEACGFGEAVKSCPEQSGGMECATYLCENCVCEYHG